MGVKVETGEERDEHWGGKTGEEGGRREERAERER